jgi:hypothetical protein
MKNHLNMRLFDNVRMAGNSAFPDLPAAGCASRQTGFNCRSVKMDLDKQLFEILNKCLIV